MSPARSALLGGILATGILAVCNGGNGIPSAAWVPFECAGIVMWACAAAVIFGDDDGGAL